MLEVAVGTEVDTKNTGGMIKRDLLNRVWRIGEALSQGRRICYCHWTERQTTVAPVPIHIIYQLHFFRFDDPPE
jgi:hypothetical protein